MHLCFMTFATPDWTLSQILTAAIRYGYDGVEPRTAIGHRHGVELGLTKAQRAEVKAAFSDCGVRMSCLATSLTYADPTQAEERIEETKRYLQLASDVGSPNLRVFGGTLPEGMTPEQGVDTVAKALARCTQAAEDCKVNLCLETHDAFCQARLAAEVVRQVNHPRLGVNWDFAHSFRVGESLEESYGHIQGHIRHSHVHDLIWPEDNVHAISFARMGTGMVPHREAIRLMAQEPADIAISLEWESQDPPEVILPEEGAALRGFIQEALAG